MAKSQAKKTSEKKEKIISNYSGNEIVNGDLNDPDLHDGQAWREGREVTSVQPKKKDNASKDE